MKKVTLVFSFLFLFVFSSKSQIINGLDTLYGNEWINFDQSYFKIMVAEDGIYQLPYQQLVDAGVPLNQIQGTEFQLFHNGEEVPIHTTTTGNFTASDRIEFYGKKNTSELDRYLFQNPEEEMMNPRYSLFTDTSAYFLTWTNTGTPLRYTEVANDLSNLPPKEEYYMAEEEVNLFSQHQKDGNSEGVRLSSFVTGTGFASNLSNVQTYTLEPDFVNSNGDNASLFVRYSGNFGEHEHEISFNDNVLSSENYFGFQVKTGEFEIPTSDLNSPLEVKFQGLVSNNDRCRVANILLSYPREFNANGLSSFKFNVEPSSSKKYFELENFNSGGNAVVAYDVLNNQRIIAEYNNNEVRLGIDGSGLERAIWMVDSNDGFKSVPSIKPTTFIDYESVDADFVFLSHPKLFNDGSGNNLVQEYADFRASNEGGNYNPIIVDVQQLYDQFGWGINRHSLSIRSFAHFIKKEWDDVKYFFIVGKGREYPSIRTASQLNGAINAGFMVPTFGTPGSDNILLSTNSTSAPIIPVGRIATTTPSQIDIVLRKVKDFQSNENNLNNISDRQWMKNIVHLGGGNQASEQELIRNLLTNMEETIEGNEFGGNVTSFYKTSTDPIQVSQSERIFDRINDGVSMITFFGHSGVGTFDFNIDNPDSYDNYKKYFVLFSLGCYSGNIHTSGIGITERFVFQEDKAALGMIGTSGFGYISSLYNVMNKYYELFGGDYYNYPIGDVLQKTLAHFDQLGNFNRVLTQQFTLHGDPAIKFFISEKPDYTVDLASVNINPKVVNARSDSFEIKFDIVNIGRNSADSIVVKVEQELPDGDVILAKQLSIPAPAYSDQYVLNLSTIGKVAVGRNRLMISVDTENKVDEISESNNELTDAAGNQGVLFFITDNSATPVYPTNFAIVGDSDVLLRASTADPLASVTKYIVEIDTTQLFTSPLKKSTEIEQAGGIIEWRPEINFENEKVYYWRISPDSLNEENPFIWENRSFTYIAGSPGGWSQRHYYQFLENRFEDVELSQASREFDFVENFRDMRIKNKVYDASEPPNGFVNGVRWSDFFRWNIHESLTVFAIDTIGNFIKNPNPGLYGSVNTSTQNAIAAFPFPVSTLTDRENVINFIDNIIPDNYWVFVYTAQRTLNHDLSINDWEADSLELSGKNIFNVLESYGATKVRSLENELTPYCFVFQKGVGKITEIKAEGPLGVINVEVPVPGLWDNGQIISTLIGPAKSWEKFEMKYDTSNSVPVDTFYTNIIGIGENGFLRKVLYEKVLNIDLDISTVNVDSFPYLQLEFYVEDKMERSPVQLKNWNILYEPYPDLAFNPENYFLFHADTLFQGDDLKLETQIANTNRTVSDSILISYSILDAAGNNVTNTQKINPLQADGETNISFQFLTDELAGRHQLLVELNSDNDQEEQFSFNNFLLKDFFVVEDKENPLLDVTFDGIHILDGDIVSPNPEIIITLEDENEFLLLNDTSSFNLFLVYPDEQLKSIPLNSSDVVFLPAESGDKNESMIRWSPNFIEAGNYALIVQANDATGNSSGTYDYKISFEVILENSLSNILAYPNPFSSATRFVYTLTGEPPAQFKIQIMTIAGRIVREIQQNELGELKIGTHKTDFIWDGTDEFGDKLANGVYLYRVMARDAMNEEYKLFETGTDNYFKQGYGKVVIVR